MAGRFDKYTERARSVLTLAQEEAQRLNHNYIGTEHLLLGLVRERGGVAAKVLSNLGLELTEVHSRVESIIGRDDEHTVDQVGLTTRAKKAIELAVDEARRLSHDYIGTEHLLIGLLREGEGIAASVLESLGANLERVRAETVRILSQDPSKADTGMETTAEAEQPDEKSIPFGVSHFATEVHRDLPASLGQDRLGFRAYARAMELMVRYTQPPLTVGILAPWGIGKSSLMDDS